MIKKLESIKYYGMNWLKAFVILLAISFTSQVNAQVTTKLSDFNIDYSAPKNYVIAEITVSELSYLDANVIIMLTGLNVGDNIQIPGDDIATAIKKLWKQGLAENIKIRVTDVQGDKISLHIVITEKPRLLKHSFVGIGRGETESLNSKINLKRGSVVTNYVLSRTRNIIRKHYVEKGFLDTDVTFKQVSDTISENAVELKIFVHKSEKVKIYQINILGNEFLSDKKAKKVLKETKEKANFNPLGNIEDLLLDVITTAIRFDIIGMVDSIEMYSNNNLKLRIFKASKLIKSDYAEDKMSLIEKYNSLGYRDARIIKDSIYRNADNTVNIDIRVSEGSRYYFRNITWTGNTKYSAEFLGAVMNIRKGDIYNKELFEKNLTYNPSGIDVSALYMNDGYLFFQAIPVEVLIENDSIDIEVRVREGKQARIKNVTVTGNTRTNDHVVMREIRTRPGQLFDREALIRTQRELAQLTYFDPETITPDVQPNQSDNTVDIEYIVEETSSDQFELSGGWGYGRIIGTFGLNFNNFSIRSLFKKGAWRPVPIGDGQKLSLRFQTYGRGYSNYSASFTEPWLGGVKPQSLSISYYHSKYS
ncbi:MAG: outer membrane protein assembly factor BamA, partial [Bacteroidetes bacterium]|nr:outer membrane protein assembly factor BamA [Bacteroidota bacterium]